jgi:hypothetical protein
MIGLWFVLYFVLLYSSGAEPNSVRVKDTISVRNLKFQCELALSIACDGEGGQAKR